MDHVSEANVFVRNTKFTPTMFLFTFNDEISLQRIDREISV